MRRYHRFMKCLRRIMKGQESTIPILTFILDVYKTFFNYGQLAERCALAALPFYSATDRFVLLAQRYPETNFWGALRRLRLPNSLDYPEKPEPGTGETGTQGRAANGQRCFPVDVLTKSRKTIVLGLVR
jgi:hypothetical protein